MSNLIQWGGPWYEHHPCMQQHEEAYGALGPDQLEKEWKSRSMAFMIRIVLNNNKLCSCAHLPVHWHPPFCAIIVVLRQHYGWRWPGPEEAETHKYSTVTIMRGNMGRDGQRYLLAIAIALRLTYNSSHFNHFFRVYNNATHVTLHPNFIVQYMHSTVTTL